MNSPIYTDTLLYYLSERALLKNFQIFNKNAEIYLSELKKLDREKEKTEKELNSSLKNKELLKVDKLSQDNQLNQIKEKEKEDREFIENINKLEAEAMLE